MSGIESQNTSNLEPIEKLAEKTKQLQEKYGFEIPDRGDLDDPSIKWRTGKPDYTRANYEYLTGKTQNHKKGSIPCSKTCRSKSALQLNSYQRHSGL